jgi:hypothetical protein
MTGEEEFVVIRVGAGKVAVAPIIATDEEIIALLARRSVPAQRRDQIIPHGPVQLDGQPR